MKYWQKLPVFEKENCIRTHGRRGGGFLLEARRGKIDIMGEVLSTDVEGIGKTEIVHRANLNFTLAGKCITTLLKEGPLNRVEGLKAICTTTD